ncbi:MAG TPA: PA2778 family cysteine peptidase [Rhizobacter sp.]|nr:PA2778 family cysteine peptidase [Rhizobacter sp.]
MVMCLAGCAVQTSALQSGAPADLPRRAELAATPFYPQTAYQCGPAALATALGAVGLSASPVELGEQVFLPARSGSLQTEMLAGARRHGAVATQIPGTLEAVLREVAAGHVVVLLQNLGLSFVPVWHYAVLVGYDVDSGEVLLRSGTTRRERLRMRTLEHTWARSGFWAFVALPPGQWPVTAQPAAVVEAAVGFERSAIPAQAVRVYDSALQRWPGNLTLAIGLGNSAYAAGDKRRAAEVFRVAAEQHGSGAAWVNLAQVLMELGEREAALAAARNAVDDPRWGARARELAQPTSLP